MLCIIWVVFKAKKLFLGVLDNFKKNFDLLEEA